MTENASVREQDATPQFAKATELLKYFGRHARTENSISTLLGLVQVAMTIALAFLVARYLNSAVYLDDHILPASDEWLALAVVLVVREIAAWVQGRIGNRGSTKIRAALREYALQRCFGLNIRLFPQFNPAEVSNLLTTEIDKQRGYFADFIPQKNLAVLMPLAIIIASAFYSWLVPLIFIFTAPLVPIFMILVGFKAADASRANIEQLNRLGDLLADRLKNLQALQLAGTTEQEGDRLFEQSESYRASTMSVLRLSFLSGTLLEFFSAISVAIIAVYLGLFFLDKYSFGSYAEGYALFHGVFLLMLAPEFYKPLRKMGALYHDRSDAVSVAEHLMKLDACYQQHLQHNPQQATADIPGLQQLSVDNLQSGDAQHAVHAPVSFTLNAGERLLLNGPSGSGKTTLLDTLAGLRLPAHGEICINGTAQTVFQCSGWFAQIGYMSQKPELLFASIRDNLTLGQSFTDEQLYAALKEAQIDELVKSLPRSLDYMISDSGGYLSGGQAQRIALARVFLHKPALLLLDEPTANLDEDTAAAFIERLNHYAQQGGMLIMASHRLAEQNFFDGEITLSRHSAESSEGEQ